MEAYRIMATLAVVSASFEFVIPDFCLKLRPVKRFFREVDTALDDVCRDNPDEKVDQFCKTLVKLNGDMWHFRDFLGEVRALEFEFCCTTAR